MVKEDIPQISTAGSATIIAKYNLAADGRVALVTWEEQAGKQFCSAGIDTDDPEKYHFFSNLIDDPSSVVAPKLMSLAECVLHANMVLGLIPPTTFPEIASPNKHRS
jgi:hypothetical protein